MGSDMVLAELDFEDEGSLLRKEHRKHRKKKAVGGGDGFIPNNSNGYDKDIVTPYHNGHYLQPNGYHHDNRSYGDFLSPQPYPGAGPLGDDRGVHSSLSSIVNNAITVAPSRTNLNDSNVFLGGRPPNFRRTRNNNRHQKHKGRSRTPDFTLNSNSNHRLRITNDIDDLPHDSQSILNRIDLSIKKNFGDWDNEDGDMNKKLFNPAPKPNKPNRVPYFIPKTLPGDSDVMVAGMTRDDLNLPRLFKPYETVVTSSRQVLNDKAYKICLSRDNADPNSILSQAKKTLSMVSGQS